MHKTTPLLVQLDGQSLGDVTVSIDESKITPELAKLNTTATTISTTATSSNTALSTVADRLTAKNAAQEDKTAAQSAVDACAKLDAMQKTIVDDVVGDLQSADGKTTIFDCASATALSLVDDPNAPAANQVRVGAAVKRIRDTIGQTTDADTENTTIGLLKKIKANTEGTGTITGTVAIKADQLAILATETTQAKLGTEATLGTRASEATLALVSKDATTQSLKAIVGTADDAADTSTVIGLLKKIKANTESTGTITGTVAIQADQLATLATEATLGTRASEATLNTRATEATLALVSKDATTQSLKALVGTADDAAGTSTVIGLLKGIAAKFQ